MALLKGQRYCIGDGKSAISTRSDSGGSGLIMSPLDIVNDLKEIDFAETAYQDFYPYLEVHVSQKVINALLDSTKPESEQTDAFKEIEESQRKLFTDECSRETLAGAWSYMHQQARKFKDKIRHENLLIDRRNKRLEEKNIQLGQKEQALFLKERDVVIREGKIMEAEPFLSLARRLQTTALEFEAILPWIETVTEVAQRTDPRTAAQYIAYELSAFRKLGGLQKELESAQKQLEILKTATAQRERGLNMIAELENKGVSLDVIYELSKVLDLQKIAKELSA